MVAAAKVFLWFILYSFFGWVYESILCSCTSHSLVNRGFLNGPLCPIYGFGAVTVILAFWWEPDISLWNLFLSSMVLTCTLEYITSWGMEKLFHARWWDYSDYRFQLNGRVCLLGAVAFGSFSVLLIKVVHPRVAALVNRLPPQGALAAAGLCFAAGALDCFVTVRHILALNGRLAEIQAAIDAYRAQSRQRAEALGQRLQARLEESVAASGLEELRERLEEIEAGKPVYVVCQSGLRSYIACRLLSGYGYETYNFSGGFRFYDAVTNDRRLTQRATACGMDQ